MNHNEAIKYIEDTAAFGTRLGLENISRLMSLLGDPQEKLQIIHIAGTNGKGSVAAYILSVLEEAGLETGFYTSPSLTDFSERIRINEEEISDDDVAYYATKVRTCAEEMEKNGSGSPSEFEIVLAMAFCYFLDRKVDIVILETGLGGRLDATNVIKRSLLTIITKISYDHMQYLGDTLPQIAYEKAAIIKPSGRVLVYPADKDVEEVIRKQCNEKKADLYIAELPSERRITEQDLSSGRTGQEFILSGETYSTLMAAAYEADNAALAVQAVRLLRDKTGDKYFEISDKSIYEGIKKTRWPGRFEILSSDPVIIVDGAHNEDGAAALAETIKVYFKDKRITLCIGILKDKQYEKMLRILLPLAEKVIACRVPNPRSLETAELKDIISRLTEQTEILTADSPEKAVEIIEKLQYKTAAVVICGSLYLAGPVRKMILDGTKQPS